MKFIIIVLSGLLFTSTILTAQYRINKSKYDLKDYHFEVGDPYNPGIMGLSSLLIPGFGQILEGEPGRGFLFMGGFVGLEVIKVFAIHGPIKAITYVLYGYHIWSMFDAYHVARVNNVAFRDKYKQTYNFRLQPYFGSAEYLNLTGEIPVGLTFLINF